MRRRAWIVSLLAALALVLGLSLMGCGKASTPAPEGGAVQEQVKENAPAAEQDSTASDETTSANAKDTSKEQGSAGADAGAAPGVSEDGTYTSKDEVALYLHTYGHLPSNYITKDEAEDAGWKTEGLSLDEACPGKSIGGDRFGNREGKLPKAKGRTWYECDIDYHGGRSRNAKRILYSNDGLIYYTEDHYKTFEQLY
jgi:hypothetical protein